MLQLSIERVYLVYDRRLVLKILGVNNQVHIEKLKKSLADFRGYIELGLLSNQLAQHLQVQFQFLLLGVVVEFFQLMTIIA